MNFRCRALKFTMDQVEELNLTVGLIEMSESARIVLRLDGLARKVVHLLKGFQNRRVHVLKEYLIKDMGRTQKLSYLVIKHRQKTLA